jgi:hypothetical protein
MYTRHNHRGLALLLVLTIVALASLIGLSILSSASLHSQVTGNTAKAAQAEFLSESAIQTAIFYIQNPSQRPASWSTHPGYTIYADEQTLSGIDGSFDLRVQPAAATDVYDVTTTGRTDGDSPVTRVASARIKANRSTPRAAASFGGGIIVGARHVINGNITAGGVVSTVGGTVNGTIKSVFDTSDYTVPTAATVNRYGAGAVPGTYVLHNGTVGVPQAVSGTITGFPALAETNPGQVYYCNGDLTVNATSAINFNGTLVVLGNLTVRGTNFTVTPTSRMPAIVTTGQLRMYFTGITLQVNGLAWVGGGTAWTGGMNTNSKLIIDGALMMPSGANLGSTVTGNVTINFAANNVNVASLTTSSQPQPIVSVSLLDWQQ